MLHTSALCRCLLPTRYFYKVATMCKKISTWNVSLGFLCNCKIPSLDFLLQSLNLLHAETNRNFAFPANTPDVPASNWRLQFNKGTFSHCVTSMLCFPLRGISLLCTSRTEHQRYQIGCTCKHHHRVTHTGVLLVTETFVSLAQERQSNIIVCIFRLTGWDPVREIGSEWIRMEPGQANHCSDRQ